MPRSTLAFTTAAIAAIALLPAAASAKSSHVRVFFPGDCQTNEYKPASIQPFCADAGMPITKTDWNRYGAHQARGHGIAAVNDCKPNCAAGKSSDHKVRIRLSRVRQCGDVPQFTRLRITFRGKAPGGFHKHLRQKVACADAPTG